MNKIDRLLNVVYQLTPLNAVFPENIEEKSIYNCMKDCFQLYPAKQTDYNQLIQNQYTEYYKETNTEDEISVIISHYISKANHCSSKSINCLELYRYVVEELLVFRAEGLTVSFDHLLEWNGLINKVDSNIFFAMKSALEHKEVSWKDTHRIKHDNERLNQLLREGIGLSENHMHLKGSGYTTEMNWFDFCCKKSITFTKLEKIIKDRRGKKSYEAFSFYKARCLKFYLFQEYKYQTIASCNCEKEICPICNKLTSEEMRYILSAQTQSEFEVYFESLNIRFTI